MNVFLVELTPKCRSVGETLAHYMRYGYRVIEKVEGSESRLLVKDGDYVELFEENFPSIEEWDDILEDHPKNKDFIF